MLREFTKAVGRYKPGQQHDYPRDIWNRLAKEFKMSVDAFSRDVESNKVLQSSLKGRPIIHRRLGATQ